MIEAEIQGIVADLLGCPVLALTAARAGGNNRIFRAETVQGAFAVKSYPSQREDPRDRLGVEWRALGFLASQGVARLPRPMVRDSVRHLAVYTWVDGQPCAPGSGTSQDAVRLGDFLIGLLPLRDRDGATDLPLASAACPAPTDAVAQLRARRDRLLAAQPDHDGLADFLRHRFLPAVDQCCGAAMAALNGLNMAADRSIPRMRLILSPSDFGLHNALRQTDGDLMFLDFEYFGWDDPVKAVADILLHPGSAFDQGCRRALFDRVLPPLVAVDDAFAARFDVLFPVYGLIWCLILLNEFLPERWARRSMAGGRAELRVEQDKQLDKATALLDWIEGFHGHHSLSR